MAKGSGALKWVGLGCGALLLFGMCVGGGVGFYFVRRQSGPVDASASFFKDVRQGQYARALQRMNGSYQGTHPLPAFQQNVALVPSLAQQTGASFNSMSESGGVATVSGNLSSPSGDVPVTVTLSKVGDYYYIDSVMVQGQTLM